MAGRNDDKNVAEGPKKVSNPASATTFPVGHNAPNKDIFAPCGNWRMCASETALNLG